MAKASRTLCVLAPFILSLATLILLILVFAGNTSTNSAVRDFYFVKLDTTDTPLSIDNPKVKDWYQIGLMNYCAGNENHDVAKHCSTPQAFYWFNPTKVWRPSENRLEFFGILKQWNEGMQSYHTATKWLFCAYIAAIATTFATLVLSAFAFCRQLGSLITSVVAVASMAFTVGAAVTATVVYTALVGFVESGLNAATDRLQLHASIGHSMFTIVWFAAATSVVACFFWFGTCCCSDGSRKKQKGLAELGIGQDAYHRVPSPLPGGNYDPYNDRAQYQWPGTSYGYSNAKTPEADAEEVPLEPYRHKYTHSH